MIGDISKIQFEWYKHWTFIYMYLRLLPTYGHCCLFVEVWVTLPVAEYKQMCITLLIIILYNIVLKLYIWSFYLLWDRGISNTCTLIVFNIHLFYHIKFFFESPTHHHFVLNLWLYTHILLKNNEDITVMITLLCKLKSIHKSIT